jgi:hypothetical protein
MLPIPVSRYRLEDDGSHDILVDNDIPYQAYYDGGVRLVDVSRELCDQGREIAVFKGTRALDRLIQGFGRRSVGPGRR